MVALVTMGAMASYPISADGIITVGIGTGGAAGLYGYVSPAFASANGIPTFGSTSTPDLIYAIYWGDETTLITSMFSRVNGKIFTFTSFGDEAIDSSTFSDYSGSLPSLAPIYGINSYDIGSELPITLGSEIPYVVT